MYTKGGISLMDHNVNEKGYFGMAWLLNLIMAIIPVTNIYYVHYRRINGNFWQLLKTVSCIK